MVGIDLIFISLYLLGILIIGIVSSTKMKNSSDMFIAGRNSSWWVAGISGYMTIFSAGTFVVWGGIAYRLGLVAISILATIGLSLILVGVFVAGKWREIGIKSPAEFLGVRFGQTTVKLYSLLGIMGRGVSMSVALYAVSILLVALIPMPDGHILADPSTGNLSVAWAILIIGVVTISYTTIGGLWAVLMTDLVQFILLVMMVVILVPLSISSVGGVGSFVDQVPQDFFKPVSGEYSLFWLILWFLLWFFQVGGDWPFVQRYISVPTAKDAKKMTFLMAGLYIISPIFWLIPTMIYRVINPGANPEQAYILMSQLILPAGVLGLMMAAMISATMSMISAMPNVYAGVFTNDIYRFYRPNSTERDLMRVGRIFTAVYGSLVIGLALIIPKLGGAEKVVVTLMTLVMGPMVIPSVWGLFSRRISQKTVWLSLGITYTIGVIVKIGFGNQIFLAHLWSGGVSISDYVVQNTELVDALIGLVIPVTILSIFEFTKYKQEDDQGWKNFRNYIKQKRNEVEDKKPPTKFKLPQQIVNWSFLTLGIAVGILAIISKTQQKILMIFSLLMLTIPIFIFLYNKIAKKN